MKEKRPAFVEAHVDMEVVHSNMASPRSLVGRSAIIRWNELPEKGKRLIARQLVSGYTLPMLPKDWQEGITAYQQK